MSRWIALVVILLAVPVQAATIRVAQDGSGDFDDLISAAQAVASGDTVLIAAGSYDSTATVDWRGGELQACFPVFVDTLTIIGESKEEVLIGPIEFVESTQLHAAGIFGSNEGSGLYVSDLTVRHCRMGVAGFGSKYVANVRFLRNDTAISLPRDVPHLVRDSYFEENRFGLYGSGSPLDVKGCTFLDNRYGARLILPGTGEIRDSLFRGFVGIEYHFAAEGYVVRNCRFECKGWLAIAVDQTASAQVVDCEFRGFPGEEFPGNVAYSEKAPLVLDGCFFARSTGEHALIHAWQAPEVVVRNCDIQKSPGLSVIVEDWEDGEYSIDMSNNYWGSSDPDTIRSRIWDAEDDSTVMGRVTFEPFSGTPLAAEQKSMGALKGSFRPKD